MHVDPFMQSVSLGIHYEFSQIHSRSFLLLLPAIGSLVLLSVKGEDPHLATSQVADWPFIQSVGGIRVGTPKSQGSGRWLLAVVCDVSGLTTITQKPTSINSGLVVTKVLHRISASELRISVAMNARFSGSRTSRCGDIDVTGASEGHYEVFYEEPNKTLHAIGTVVFSD